MPLPCEEEDYVAGNVVMIVYIVLGTHPQTAMGNSVLEECWRGM